jgi:hypothetical protein
MNHLINHSKKLIWLCPKSKKAIGGVKIIYRQASLVQNHFSKQGLQSYVVHPNSGNYRVSWFDSDTIVMPIKFGFRWNGKLSRSNISKIFNQSSDVVVIPEMWASKYGPQLRKNRIPYVIYVQNGYQINTGSLDDLRYSYEGASVVMVISEDAKRCVNTAFPDLEINIKRIHYSIDDALFKNSSKKENLITYMPRKLSNHSELVLFFLQARLPANWRIEKIENMSEMQVASLLKRSRIFMSFSNFEGCPLPPLEAGLTGNFIVGYTGQGGREYWIDDIYHAIEEGDVIGFANKVLENISIIDNGLSKENHKLKIQKLMNTYSKNAELNDIQEILSYLELI